MPTSTPKESERLLEGVDKLTKLALKERLRDAAKRISGYEAEGPKRLREIEKRVKSKAKATKYDLKQVIFSGNAADFEEAVEFLDNVADYLPPVLVRLNDGMKVLLGKIDIDKPSAASPSESAATKGGTK